MVGKCQSIFLVADGQFDTLPQKDGLCAAKTVPLPAGKCGSSFRGLVFFLGFKSEAFDELFVKRIPINVPRDAGLEILLKKVLE